MEISIDVEDVAESDISLTEYANRYLSQKGNAGRKTKGGEAVHPKFAIALAATQAKTSKSGRGSSNAFAAFADADENNDESAVAEEDDDDGWNTVPARNHVPTHPWHRAAARKSFGADHHRPSFNSSNKTTGVYFDARRCDPRPSLTRDDVNRYFEPTKSDRRRESDGRHVRHDTNRHTNRHAESTREIEWAEVDTSKALPSFSIGASHARETHEFEEWKKTRIVAGDKPRASNISPMVSPLSGGFAAVAPLTPPGLRRPTGFQTSQTAPLSPPFERTHAVEPGLNGKPNYFSESEGMPQVMAQANTAQANMPQVSTAPILGSPMVGSSHMIGSPSMVDSHMAPMANPPMIGNVPSMNPGPYFAVVLPPEICDQIRRGLLPPPPPPPPMHMMWRGGPLPPGVGIPVPVLPW